MKHRTMETLIGVCALVLVGAASVCQAQPPAGGLPNGSFERQRDGRPEGWRTEKWGGDGVCEVASHRPHGRAQRTDRLRERRRYRLGRTRTGRAARAVSPVRPGSRRRTSRRRTARGAAEPPQPPARGHQGADRHERLDAGRGRLRDRGAGRGPGELPVRRLGPADGQGVVRRRRPWSCFPRSPPLQPSIAIDAGKTGEPDLEVHLRPVHRAPGPLHLRRHLGRDARGPQVLRRRSGQGRVAVEGHRTGRRGEHGPGRAVRRRAHAADRAARRPGLRDRAGRPGPGRGQGVRRADLAGRERGRRAGPRQPGLGRRPERPPDGHHRRRSADAYAKTPLRVHRRRDDRRRPPGDRRRGQGPYLASAPSR